MTDIKPENRPFYWAAIFLRALRLQGLKHIVISPGSRSTPLTLAAATLPGIEQHVVLDERSAAFMALGIGKATGRPAALICTSGTAVANYFPAAIEARMSGTPLLLLTADRPPHLHDTGANQSIDQQKIFGRYPVFFHDMGEPILDENSIESLQKTAGHAFSFAKSRKGPVHLNFPFRKPLEPRRDFLSSIINENKKLDTKKSVSFTKSTTERFRFDDDLLHEIHETERPLIIAGQLSPDTELEHIFRLAERLKAPVLSEQGIINQAYAIQGFEGFLRNKANQEELEPDLILRFGLQPASKSLLQAIKSWAPKKHVHFSDTGRPSNIAHTTTNSITWSGGCFDIEKLPKKSEIWLKKWKRKDKLYAKAYAKLLEDESPLTDGHIYHHLTPEIPNDWWVFISNSFPARDHSMFGQWSTQKIFTNRGVSGIDGISSTAMGVNIGSHQPGILFTGDLAFLHDTNALLNARELQQPLVIVIINNEGGSIFRMLPVAQHDAYFTPYFETPQQADIAALAKGYALNYILIDSIPALMQLELDKITSTREHKLHIIECRTDAGASMDIRNTLWNTAL